MMKQGGQKGFTLIETIVAIVVAGLLGLMIFMFARAGVENAPTPWLRVVAMADLRQVMEDMNEDYFRYQHALPWETKTYVIEDRVRSTDNRFGYECIKGGVSTAEPVWPDPPTETVFTDADGIEWKYFLVAMKEKISIPVPGKEYGGGAIDFTVIDNEFVREDLANPGTFTTTGATVDDYLKVTIGKISGAPGETAPQKIMTLFCQVYTL